MATKKRLIDANELLRNAEDYGPISAGLADAYDIKWLVDAQHTVAADENFIYKAAFEIAVRCARELSGTPELKEAYQEAQKDNRALRSFMDFCLQKAAEELPEQNAVEVVPINYILRNIPLSDIPKIAESAPIVTNGDKVRAMSDEELADWLLSVMRHGVACFAEGAFPYAPCRNEDHNCLQCGVAWLKQPAEVEDGQA